VNKHRFAALMTIGAYPMVVAILYFLPHSFMMQPHWIKGIVMVPIMVVWMFYVVSPAIQRYMASWIGLRSRSAS